MTQYSPLDEGFSLVVHELIDVGTDKGEKLVFIDTADRIREVVYPDQFDTDAPQQARQRLEGAGELKGVVHVSALHIGQKNYAPRISFVEYLPDKQTYQYRFTPDRGAWEKPVLVEEMSQDHARFWREE